MAYLIECRVHTGGTLKAPLLLTCLVDTSRTTLEVNLCLNYRVWERLPRDDRPIPWCPIVADYLGGAYMPWAVPAGSANVAEISVQAEYGGQVIINRWHYRIQATATDYNSNSLLTGVINLWRTYMLLLQDNLLAVKYYVAKLMSFAPIPEGHFSYDFAEVRPGTTLDVGGQDFNGAPAYVAATVQLHTDRLGRRAQGSKRIAGIVEVDTEPEDPNYLTVGARDAFQAAANAIFLTPIVGTDSEGLATPIIASVMGGEGFFPTNPASWPNWAFPITSTLVNRNLGSQVSRKSRGEG